MGGWLWVGVHEKVGPPPVPVAFVCIWGGGPAGGTHGPGRGVQVVGDAGPMQQGWQPTPYDHAAW